MLDNQTRLEYLQLMGVQVWLARQAESLDNDESCLDDVRLDQAAIAADIAQSPVCVNTINCQPLARGLEYIGAEWLFVLEASQAQSELSAEASALLSELLFAMGLQREQINVLILPQCAQAASPAKKDLSCIQNLQACITRLQPKVLCILGSTLLMQMLEAEHTCSEKTAKLYKFADRQALVNYHPAQLMQSAENKRQLWLDVQLAMKSYQRNPVQNG